MRAPADELTDLDTAQLRRSLRRLDSPQATVIEIDGRQIINFSSNDYLGLANDTSLKAAFAENIQRHGVGAGASRLICGSIGPHFELETTLAEFKGTEAALTFSTGYAAAVGIMGALLQKGDVVILDKLCHASLIDGARLSGATIRVFPHNRVDKLASHLEWAEKTIDHTSGRILVATESIFSMDGDAAPLMEITDLVQNRALLLVDEAHAFGIFGKAGRGLAEELGVEDKVDLHMGTLSKAAGLSGGYVCARRELIDLLINRARSFIYSTAPSPALAATAKESIELVASSTGDQLRSQLFANIERFGLDSRSPIQPVILGESQKALAMAGNLLEHGFLAPAIRYPTVPANEARLRITLTAKHQASQIDQLIAALPNRDTP